MQNIRIMFRCNMIVIVLKRQVLITFEDQLLEIPIDLAAHCMLYSSSPGICQN